MHVSLETKQMMNNTVCAIYFMLLPHLLLPVCSRTLYSKLITEVPKNRNQ